MLKKIILVNLIIFANIFLPPPKIAHAQMCNPYTAIDVLKTDAAFKKFCKSSKYGCDYQIRLPSSDKPDEVENVSPSQVVIVSLVNSFDTDGNPRLTLGSSQIVHLSIHCEILKVMKSTTK